jgi:hypothetical protein
MLGVGCLGGAGLLAAALASRVVSSAKYAAARAGNNFFPGAVLAISNTRSCDMLKISNFFVFCINLVWLELNFFFLLEVLRMPRPHRKLAVLGVGDSRNGWRGGACSV